MADHEVFEEPNFVPQKGAVLPVALLATSKPAWLLVVTGVAMRAFDYLHSRAIGWDTRSLARFSWLARACLLWILAIATAAVAHRAPER